MTTKTQDGAVPTVTKSVNMARMGQPRFLSLVGLPANQVAFKVIRNDNGELTMAAPHIARKRNTQRSDTLVSIEFELETSDDTIKSTMADWGVTDYTVETTADKKVVKCADAGTKSVMRIDMGGKVATILKPISNSSENKPHISVVRYTFDKEAFPVEDDIGIWMRSHHIDFSGDKVENQDLAITVTRGAPLAEGEDTRTLEVDTGVRLTVCRADTQDVPDDLIAVVNDTAYGSWGWGQLDFTATMADVEFCEVGREAMETLDSVIRNILFYSDLPVAVRKDLVVRATSQFSDFIVTLMDALPARVVVANRSLTPKETPMSNATAATGTTTTADPVVADATTADAKSAMTCVSCGCKTAKRAEACPECGAPDPSVAKKSDTLTRADVAQMITEAVTSALAAQAVVRSEPAATPAADPAPAPAASPVESELLVAIRSVQALGESVKAVAERVQSLEGATTVRSDGGDGKQTARKDVFAGMFGKATA